MNYSKIKFLPLLILLILLSQNILRSQNLYEKNFYGGLFYISYYMTSDEYINFAKSHTDLESVDHIYSKALSFFNGDISESLFCLTFTMIPYNRIMMKLPITGTTVSIPLPSPPQKIFNEKKKNTPKKIFFDSPNTNSGDKDKLAHFFGNAFLHYNVSFFNLSKFLGIFVEYFEQGFFLQGDYDNRDLVANHLGDLFAVMLKTNPSAKPSEALIVYQLLYFRICP